MNIRYPIYEGVYRILTYILSSCSMFLFFLDRLFIFSFRCASWVRRSVPALAVPAASAPAAG